MTPADGRFAIDVIEAGPAAPGRQPVFFYDLGSPDCYLVAERISSTLPVVAEWEPVLGSRLGLGSPPLHRDRLQTAVAELGLQALRLPARWPADSELAMLAATYAKGGGKIVAYSLAAFRQTFAGGRDLGDEGTVLIAAAACEMHPRAVLKGVGLRSTNAALDAACARARASGVTALPGITVGTRTYCGEDALRDAAQALAAPSGR
jgi:2-hydroxychromene-2-carboxylate isomerase